MNTSKAPLSPAQALAVVEEHAAAFLAHWESDDGMSKAEAAEAAEARVQCDAALAVLRGVLRERDLRAALLADRVRLRAALAYVADFAGHPLSREQSAILAKRARAALAPPAEGAAAFVEGACQDFDSVRAALVELVQMTRSYHHDDIAGRPWLARAFAALGRTQEA